MHRETLILGLMLSTTVLMRNASAEPTASTARDNSAAKDRGAAILEFEDVEGARHRPMEVRPEGAAVVIFVLHDCPISNRYAPEIKRLADEFSGRRVPFYLVHVDPKLSAADAKKHSTEYGYKLPVLVDRRHKLVKHLNATTAPEAFVVGAEGKVLYRGRIDDRYAAIGKPRNQVQRQDLRLALSAVLAGKPVEVAETKAVGCYIPELEE